MPADERFHVTAMPRWIVGWRPPVRVAQDAFVPGGFPEHAQTMLWGPLSAAIAVTGLAMYRGRRARPFCCEQYGYDFRGNVSDRCPECGEEFRSADTELPPRVPQPRS